MSDLGRAGVHLELVQKLTQLFREPTFDNITNILIYTMQFLGRLKGVPGQKKKEIAVNSIVHFVDITDMTGDLEPVVLRILPGMIDNLIAVDKHSLVINPRAKNIFRKALGLVKSIPFPCKGCKK